MTAWETNDNLTPREEAISLIKDLAKSKNINGSFKVFYDGQLISDPTNLPERVDMNKVKVSATLDQA